MMNGRALINLLMAMLVFAPVGCKTESAINPSVPVLSGAKLSELNHLPGLEDRDTRAAAKLYVAKCARCHPLYDPVAYDADAWHSWTVKMSKKARLQPDQDQLLLRFREALRAQLK